MGDFDLDSRTSNAGRADSGGSFFHVSFRSGTRAGGVCASAAYEYVAREGDYDGAERDEAVHVESGRMPSWAEDDPHAYWDAADLYERANGRLYVAGDFALPRGLNADDQVELAREFVEALTGDENLPYTFAIHAGHDRDGEEHNPHVHVMISERTNDGIERSREEWFRRANRDHPDRGGARKSRAFHGHTWVELARQTLASGINRKLETLDRQERVSHQSYQRQNVDGEPGEHFGPSAPYLVDRDYPHDRLDDAAARREYPDQLADLDRRIDRMQQRRDALACGRETADLGPARSDGSYSGSSSRDDDSRGR